MPKTVLQHASCIALTSVYSCKEETVKFTQLQVLWTRYCFSQQIMIQNSFRYLLCQYHKISALLKFSSVKAILQVLIYKALYDKSYLGSKTTMTSGEWTFLISFATAPFGTGRERKIQNENICLQRDSNPRPASPRQESCSALDRSATRAWWWSVVKCLAG